MSVAAVVLAAGASTRLGRPKQLVNIGGETLVERAVRVAQEAGCSPVIVVLTQGDLIGPLRVRGAEPLLNRRSFEGISTSIVVGVQWAKLQNVTGVLLMTCDQIATTANHLRALCADPETRTGSGYAGRVGVPAYFPSASFSELMDLKGDFGARDLLRQAPSVVDETLALDVDTEEDVQRARELFG